MSWCAMVVCSVCHGVQCGRDVGDGVMVPKVGGGFGCGCGSGCGTGVWAGLTTARRAAGPGPHMRPPQPSPPPLKVLFDSGSRWCDGQDHVGVCLLPSPCPAPPPPPPGLVPTPPPPALPPIPAPPPSRLVDRQLGLGCIGTAPPPPLWTTVRGGTPPSRAPSLRRAPDAKCQFQWHL